MTHPGGIHPNAWRALLKSAKQGSWSQLSFRTEGAGAGAGAGVLKGLVMIGLPGPMPEEWHQVMRCWNWTGCGGWNNVWDAEKEYRRVHHWTVLYCWTHWHKDWNRPQRFEWRLERSHGGACVAGWEMGRDSVSSAQLKPGDADIKWEGTAFGNGKTGGSGSKMGSAGSRWGIGNE